MPIVFHLARISLLFRQENLKAIKGKAVSSSDNTSCDNSQFTSWCHTFVWKMNTLFNYFVPKDGLPSPRGLLRMFCHRLTSNFFKQQSSWGWVNNNVKTDCKKKVFAPYNRWHSLVMRSVSFCIWLFHVLTLHTRYSTSQCANLGSMPLFMVWQLQLDTSQQSCKSRLVK